MKKKIMAGTGYYEKYKIWKWNLELKDYPWGAGGEGKWYVKDHTRQWRREI